MRSYNIIDSVKGGSGKTSLALMLTIASTMMYQRSNPALSTGSQQTTPAILLDMDMQGSSLASLLFGSNDPEQAGLAKQYLNDRILKYYRNGITATESISYPVFYLSGHPATTVRIAASIASPIIEDRNRFRAHSRTNFSSVITYQSFRAGLQDTLEKLGGALSNQVDSVFFDMPPNSNGYSDAVLELLLGQNSALAERHPCNYFELTTLDQGHISASLNWFESFVNDEQYEFPDHFFFVFDNVPDSLGIMDTENELVKGKVSEMSTKITKILSDSLPGHEKRIFFVGVKYQPNYLEMCCSREGIGAGPNPSAGFDDKKIRLAETILKPITFIKDLEGKLVNCTDSTEKLLSMIKENGG